MTAQQLADKIKSASVWDLADCGALCAMAGMTEAWDNADADTFEEIVMQAARRLGVEVV